MKTDNYTVPIVIGVISEGGIDVNDQILEKLVTPQLIKIKNTFPNSPFLVLSPLSNDKERLTVRILIERLESDVISPQGKGPNINLEQFQQEIQDSGLTAISVKTISLENKRRKGKTTTLTPELFTAAEAQILIAVTSGTDKDHAQNEDELSEVSSALKLRSEGLLRDIYSTDEGEKGVLDSSDVGLTITINPETFDISSTVSPAEETQPGTEEPGKASYGFAEKISVTFNAYIGRVTRLFDRFYNTYIEVPDEGEKDRLASSEFVEIAEKIDGYNKDVLRFLESKGEEPAVKSQSLLLSGEDENPLISKDEGLSVITLPYSGSDILSQYYQKKTNRYINWIYILFFTAVLLYGIIDLNYYLVLFYIALIPAIAFLVYRSKAEKLEDRFLDYRALAEGLRVKVFWRIAGVDERVSSNYLSKYAGLVSWISRAIKNLEILSLSDDLNHAKFTSAQKKERLRITKELWIDSQLEYYGKKRNPLYMRSLDLTNLALVSFVFTLFFALVFGIYLLFAGLGNDGVIMRFEVLIGAAAAIGVAAQAYKSKKAYEELERRYKLTEHIYRSARKKLEAERGSPERILAALGKEALIENSDWLWTHRNLPIELPKG